MKSRDEFSHRVNKKNFGLDDGEKGRLTINTAPTRYRELLDKMKTDAKNGVTTVFWSYKRKIAGPARFGRGTEDGLFYLMSISDTKFISQENLNEIADRVKLRDDYIGTGLRKVCKGEGYAERPVPPHDLQITYGGKTNIGAENNHFFQVMVTSIVR